MNVDEILRTFNRRDVAYLLIGGMNFLLRHGRALTFDLDFWVEDTPENLHRCELALADLAAEWGASGDYHDWGLVSKKAPGWTGRQTVFCLASPHGAIDLFRAVAGLDSWATCRGRAVPATMASGVPYLGLADSDMLACQMALPQGERKLERIRTLNKALQLDQEKPHVTE